MTEENVRELWSDEELDIALATLRSTVDTEPDRLARSRAELMAAAGAAVEAPVVEPLAEPASPSRRRTWGVVAAAAAVTVVASAVVVGLVQSDDDLSPAYSVEQLERAADNTSDEPVGPGQYRYIARHESTMVAVHVDDGEISLSEGEQSRTVWAPHDERDDWMMRSNCTASGSPPDGDPNRGRCVQAAREDVTPCGEWDNQVNPETYCSRMGAWTAPNRLFLDSLPRDPDALRDRLLADWEAHWRDLTEVGPKPDVRPESRVMHFARELLNTGLAPADVRATVYRMISRLPGIEVTDPDASLDGRGGVAFGIVEDGVRYEIVVDPETGEYIGDRRVYLSSKEAVAAGTRFATSVRTAVVDDVGQKP